MRTISTLVVAAMLVAACGGSGDDSDAGAPPETDTAMSTDTTGDDSGTAESIEATGDDAGVDIADTSTTAAPATTTTVPVAVADAILIEPNLDLRPLAATAFAPVIRPAPVAVGDVLRTDTTGYAEINYFDGSLTRLDIDTEFEVLELVDTIDTSTIRTRMGVGRTWHRVQQLAETDTYEVETSVATAVVQGTAFTIACPTDTTCTFLVVEGALLVTLTDGTEIELVAPTALTIDDTGAHDPIPVTYDGAFADQWLLDNATRDTQAGYDGPADIYQTHGPAYASLTGTFTVTRTVTAVTCVTHCLSGASEADIGFSQDFDGEYHTDCSGGTCAVVGQSGIPYSFDGTSYTVTIPTEYAPGENDCTWVPHDGGSTEVTGSTQVVVDVTITPTAAEVREGVYVVTEFDYAAIDTETVEGHCAEADGTVMFEEYLALEPFGGSTVTWSGTASR